jgi:hypothetical protein
MPDPFVIGWDLGSVKNGWCAGDGSRVPAVGAFRLDRIERRDQIGHMGVQFKTAAMVVHRRFPEATHWISEGPLMLATDNRWTVERLMGLSAIVQTIGVSLGKRCRMIDPGEAKQAFMARRRSPDPKADMVAMALQLGIPLPEHESQGRSDIADAAAVWKFGLRWAGSPHATAWDGAVSRRAGGLL